MKKAELLKLVQRVSDLEVGLDQYSEVNQYLMPLGLARWYGGKLVLSEKGKQYIFQHECTAALQAVIDGRMPDWNDATRSWLLKQEFIVGIEKLAFSWQATPRGREWMSQMG